MSGSKWPIVARDDVFRQALAALDERAEFQGVALVGDSGVGKSTLARALAHTVEAAGLTPQFMLGTQTGRAVPLGAFARAVTADSAHEPATMLAAAHKTLEREENLLIVVDDAQLLDPLSATLVYQLAASGSARFIVTIRSGEAALDAVTVLLKERLLLTLYVDAFTREQTGELARRVLGGAVAPRLIDELYSRSGGNLLLLRGLLSAGRENGVLAHTEDGWQLRVPLRGDRKLYDLIEFSLRSLNPAELKAVEVLATAEMLDWDVLRELCDADAVANLERRGLIQLVANGSEVVARLNHAVIGEAAIRLAGVVRSRQLNGLLAQALRKHEQIGGRRSRLPDVRGQIRLAQFMMRSDLKPDPKVIIRAAASAVAMSNLGYGEELARFALDLGGGVPAALVLAEAMSWQGRGRETEKVLAGVRPEAGDELVRWGCLRAANLFWGCGQVDAARQGLAEVRDRVDSAAGIGLVSALEVSFAFFSGDVATAIETGLAVCATDPLPLATVWVAMAISTSWALALVGRFGEHQIADAGPRGAAFGESETQRLAIGLAEVMALTAVGDISAAEHVSKRFAATSAGASTAEAVVEAIRGHVDLARGRLSAACAEFHTSVSAMSPGFPPGWLMLAAAWSAQAEGARGDTEAAVNALRISEKAYGPQVAVFLPELELARAWERASVGETTAAQLHSFRAAQIARRAGMWEIEMRALHTAVRFGDRSHATRVAELAETLNTPMAEAVAAHARGIANHEGDLLDAVADKFAEMGALALAADAAAQAAREHAQVGHRGKELESSARAHRLARKGRVRTPAVNASARPLPITDRQHEIAMLVAAGLSNRQIAGRLFVSVRTVDGHLYRIFGKLGIDRRDQLVHLVSGIPASA